MRTTKTELREYVDYLREYTKLRLTIQWAYGRPRVYKDNDELSPRLTTGQMRDWLNAFALGYTHGKGAKPYHR